MTHVSRAQILDRSFFNRTGVAFGVLASVQVTLIAAITVVVVALPRISGDLDLNGAQTILVSSGYGLSFSGLLLLGSRLGDRWGHGHCLRAGLLVFVAGSVAGGLATGWAMLIAGRLVQGVGAALAAPAAMGLLAAVFPDARTRGRALASWGVLASVGAVAGTLAGGALAGVVSWRWCLLGVAVAGAAELVAAGRLVPAGSGHAPVRLDVAGAVTGTGAICLLSYGLIGTSDHPWTSVPVLAPIAAGALLLLGFLAVERRAVAPLLPLGLLAHPRRAGALATIWVSAAATAIVSLFSSLYFQQVQGRSALETTALLVPLGVTFTVAAIAVRFVVARLGPTLAAIGGLVLAAVGLALLGQLDVHTAYVGPILAGLVIFPAAAGLSFAAGTVLALDGTPPANTGAVVGMANMAMETGPTVGLALLVSLASTVTGPAGTPAALSHGYSAALRAAAAAMLAVALAVVVLRRSRAEQPPQKENP